MHDHPTVIEPFATEDFLSVHQLSTAELERLFRTAHAWKRDPAPYAQALAGKSIVMLFEKASLRTRLSFEVGIHRLGGQAVYYDHSGSRIGQRESIRDYAKNLECWVHAIVARVYSHKVLEEMAQHATIPVINALCDLHHPCQAVADLFTLEERFGSVKGLRMAWVGDGNNVCHSLMITAMKLGVHMTVITPPQYAPKPDVVAQCLTYAQETGATLTLTSDPSAVSGHDAVYTDVWTSMGSEAESAVREQVFKPFQVNARLMSHANMGALFMHCLPAHRGMEVTDEVIDGPYSVVLDQAENRMHVQNALLLHMLAPGFKPQGSKQPTVHVHGSHRVVDSTIGA